MSSLSRRLRRRSREAAPILPPLGPGLPLGPGTHLMTLSHDPWCKAPELECTCKPDITITRATRSDLAAAVRVEHDLRAKIRKSLD